YRKAFGWTTKVISDSADFRYTVLEKDEQQYAGIMDAAAFLPSGVPSSWQVYLQVADVDATLTDLVELGGSVRQPAEDTPYPRLAARSTGRSPADRRRPGRNGRTGSSPSPRPPPARSPPASAAGAAAGSSPPPGRHRGPGPGTLPDPVSGVGHRRGDQAGREP